LPRARQLLSEAGFSHGFSVTLDCPNDRYVMDGEICTAITAMLARIGITADLNAQPKSKYFAETAFPNYHTSLYLLGWTPSTDDALNVINALLVTRRNGNGLVNNGGYSNPRVDQLARRIAIEPDPAKRTAMIRQVTKLVQQDVGYIPLHQQTILWAARSNVELAQMADDTFPLRYVQVR
jgi:peptide/nickel transport system substrate-binding protein